MATLVLTAAGTALGGPIGGALGGLVGQSIDQQLFGPGIRKGPRLNDLAVQTSSYGSPVPRIYGTMRVAGTIIWATDIQEGESVEGGGKGSPEYVSYGYSVSLAVALSSRPVRAVKRIWADGKLIRGAAGDFKVKTQFRLLDGSQNQAIDPLIASVETIAQTPAYRGLALALFEDLALGEFGNRIPALTFEIEADDGGISLSELLHDASGGSIHAEDSRPIPGFAVHGTSIGDSLSALIEVMGIDLVEQNGLLRSPSTDLPLALANSDLGCSVNGGHVPPVERRRAPDSALPSNLTMTYYDPGRDYQTGQMRASTGYGGVREERIELPAVLGGDQAKSMAEESLVRRWRSADRLRLALPPSRMDLQPGDRIQLPNSSRVWAVRSAIIDGMAVAVEAEPAPTSVQPLPADGGRAVSEPDLAVGRSELALFELPSLGDAPQPSAICYIAAANEGLWKQLPAELLIGDAPLTTIALARRAVLGSAKTVLESRALHILDEMSAVTVLLTNPTQPLLNADEDGLMAGANLALIGNELIQFGRAEPMGAGLYRLSKLLRGRRGTEWAAGTHAIGELFCLVDFTAIRPIDTPPSAIGANLSATAYGIGDSTPLPTAQRMVSGEALRPPSPCHLKLRRSGAGLVAEWTRRSHRGWAWNSGLGVAEDPFTELYRLTVNGPGGQLVMETPTTSANVAQPPGAPGQTVSVSVSMIGPLALSHEISATIQL